MLVLDDGAFARLMIAATAVAPHQRRAAAEQAHGARGSAHSRADHHVFHSKNATKLLESEQPSLLAAYHAVDSKFGKGRMAERWEVGLWQEGGQVAYSHGQFRSVFSVRLFI